MTLSMEDFNADANGWNALLPRRTKRVAKPLPTRVKWTVVGAGLTGLACARRLATMHPNDEILLLDAREIGQGASGRNSGYAVAISQFSGAYDAKQKSNYDRINRINQAGLDILRGQIQQHKIDCQWDENGFYHTAADTVSVRKHAYFLRYLDALDVPHTALNQEQLQARLGTPWYKCGVHVPQGALLQPAALVRGLALSLPPNVHLAENTPVLKIESGTPNIVHLAEQSLKTDRLILAVNYEAGKLGFLRRRILGSTLSGSVTRVLTDPEMENLGSLKHWGALSLHSGGATVRLTQDRRLCLRNTAEYHGGKLLSRAQLEHRKTVHRAAFNKRFAALSHVPFEHSWSGVEGISRNGTNFFGQQGNSIYLAGGFNGSGVSRGTAFGTALAEYASGHSAPLIDDCLASAPAAYMPPRPFLDIGAFFTVRNRFRGVGLDR